MLIAQKYGGLKMNEEQLTQYEEFLNAIEAWVNVQKSGIKNFRLMKGFFFLK